MAKEQRDLFPSKSKDGNIKEVYQRGSSYWGRVNPNALFPNVCTNQCAPDSRMGCCLHWHEHRYLTVAEAQRAQSFPDDEVLVGLPIEQYKILGNSVARSVALALGLSIRDAWFKRSNSSPTPKRASTIVGAAVPRVTRSGKNQSQSDESHNSEDVSSTDEVQTKTVISNVVRIHELSSIAAAEESDDSSDDLSDKLSEGSLRELSEEAITKESFSRLIKAFELSEASHLGKAGPAADDKVEIRTVSTMSHCTVKETRILPPIRSNSSLANVKSVLENSSRSSVKRPYYVPQETGILPPSRNVAFSSSSGTDSAINRSASSTPPRRRTPLLPRKNNLVRSMGRRNSKSRVVGSNADELIFMGETTRQSSESDHLVEALRHVKEELHFQNPDYFADGDADSDSDLYSNTRFESESGSDHL